MSLRSKQRLANETYPSPRQPRQKTHVKVVPLHPYWSGNEKIFLRFGVLGANVGKLLQAANNDV